MTPSTEDHVKFWRAFGEALAAGKKLVEALAEARRQLIGTSFEGILDSVTKHMEAGMSLSEALLAVQDVFDPRIVAAAKAGADDGALETVALQISNALEAGDLGSLDVNIMGESMGAEAKDVNEYFVQLMGQAVASRASDIHFDPAEGGAGSVRLRVDGVLREIGPPPEGVSYRAAIARVKVMANMDLAERRLPQDGRIGIKLDDKDLDLRVSLIPAHFGERMVLRILDRQQVMLGLTDIGLGGEDLEKVLGLCHLPNGIVVATGPAGSGKTTLLYSMLNEVNRPETCVLTVEDPVEYAFDRVGQMQIRPQLGLTYARALRCLLRQDPDVILLGEIRDLDALNVAVQVALTGHLLLTTMHSNTAVGAIQRLLDVGLEPFQINATLKGVIAQRLVRVLCQECKAAVQPPRHSMPPEALAFLDAHADATFFGPKGCEKCARTGYRGRTGVWEILTPDDRVRQLVSAGADLAAVRDAARVAGMRTMLECGLDKAAAGVTSIEEVLRVVPPGNAV